MAHLSSRTRRALRVRDSDARHEHHWARLRQLSCGTSRNASTHHTVHRGSAQHVPPRTLVGSVMMNEACPSADLQCEKQEIDGLEEGVRAYCASGEYGLLTKLTSPRGHSLAGNRGTGLPAVRACGEPRRRSTWAAAGRGWRRGSLRRCREPGAPRRRRRSRPPLSASNLSSFLGQNPFQKDKTFQTRRTK